MKRTLIAALLASTLALPVMADEVWSTVYGDIIYESDLDNGMAVLSYPVEEDDPDSPRGEMFVAELAGNYEDRSTHDGIWIEPSTDGGWQCDVAIAHPVTGEPAWNWGRLEVIFLTPAFPSGFVVRGGTCFDEIEPDAIIAEPVTG